MGLFSRLFEPRKVRVKRLWQEAVALGNSAPDQKRALSIYTLLLTLVNEQNQDFDVCSILRNRAIALRTLKQYDAALSDLTRELEIAQRNDDQDRIPACQKMIRDTQEWKQKGW